MTEHDMQDRAGIFMALTKRVQGCKKARQPPHSSNHAGACACIAQQDDYLAGKSGAQLTRGASQIDIRYAIMARRPLALQCRIFWQRAPAIPLAFPIQIPEFSMHVRSIAATALCLAVQLAHGADQISVTVSHVLGQARPAETITVAWRDVNRLLPGALLQHISVKDAAGRMLPYQVTNVAPQAKDPLGQGIAYGELIFQHDFAAGERAATFTIEKTETLSPVFPSKVFARFVPERLDDFA